MTTQIDLFTHAVKTFAKAFLPTDSEIVIGVMVPSQNEIAITSNLNDDTAVLQDIETMYRAWEDKIFKEKAHDHRATVEQHMAEFLSGALGIPADRIKFVSAEDLLDGGQF